VAADPIYRTRTSPQTSNNYIQSSGQRRTEESRSTTTPTTNNTYTKATTTCTEVVVDEEVEVAVCWSCDGTHVIGNDSQKKFWRTSTISSQVVRREPVENKNFRFALDHTLFYQ
jgi:hypothetical protein